MDSKKRIFLSLTIWAISASLVFFILWRNALDINHEEDQYYIWTPNKSSPNISLVHGVSKSQTKMNSSIEDSYQRRRFPTARRSHGVLHDLAPIKVTSRFRRQFLQWDQSNKTLSSLIGPQCLSSPDKYLIYRCDMTRIMRNCGGWADRVKGMLLTYVMANLTGRVFKIEMLKPPCNLLRYLTPNLVNWSLPVSSHERVGKGKMQFINKVDSVSFLASIHKTNFTEMIEEKRAKYTYFKANLDYSKGLQNNKLYSQQLSWMADLSNDVILSTLFKRVFRLSGYLEQRMNHFMQQTLPTARHRLICAHVRMGANPSIPNDSEVRFHQANLNVVWKFLSEHSKTDKDKIFLMSDSENVVDLGKSQPFGHRLVDSGGTINHVDKSGHLDIEERCAGLEKVIFDQHVLMQCDVLLISLSGVSRMAAYVRGSDKGLYCLTRKSTIVPCKPKNIKKIYRIMG